LKEGKKRGDEMDSPNPDHTLKRKRSPVPPPPLDDARGGGVGVGQMPQPVTQINYLMRAKGEKLKLVDGDADTFKDVLEIIDDYEGVFFSVFFFFTTHEIR